MINAKIIADSVCETRLTTFVLTYPRFIHAEFMTHRMFSRNASSSRAIPVKRQIEEIMTNPARPIDFRKNQSGMQAGEPLENQQQALDLWLKAKNRAVEVANEMIELGIHKQYANRILEPFAHITVVVSATDWANFFSLRISPMAQPEIMELAKQMYLCYTESQPKDLCFGQWHLPFVDDAEILDGLVPPYNESIYGAWGKLIKRSVARCARVSYLNHDSTVPTPEQDEQLYDRLVGSVPLHASPTEHQATPASNGKAYSGNFRGWVQYRKKLLNENVREYRP